MILGYYEDGPDLVSMAMNGWGAAEPAWWLNLQGAGGWGRVQLGPRTFDIRAEVAPAPRRQALWERFVQAWPPYEDYRKATTREFPVIILHALETERVQATCRSFSDSAYRHLCHARMPRAALALACPGSRRSTSR